MATLPITGLGVYFHWVVTFLLGLTSFAGPQPVDNKNSGNNNPTDKTILKFMAGTVINGRAGRQTNAADDCKSDFF
jgi:hypothetical protein